MSRLASTFGDKIDKVYRVLLQVVLPVYLLISPMSSRSATLFLILIALASLGILLKEGWPHTGMPRRQTGLWLAPLLIIFLLSPIWAENMPRATQIVASMIGLGALAAISLMAARRENVRLALPAPVLLGIAGAAIWMAIVLQYPPLAGELLPNNFNRSAISFAMIYWVLMMRLFAGPDLLERRLLIVALIACGIAVFISDTQSAMLGLVAGHVVFFFMLVAADLAVALLAAGTIIALLFVKPAIRLLSSPALEPFFASTFLQHGAGSIRRSIWQEYAAMADDRFWLGFGPGTVSSLAVKERLVTQHGGTFQYFLDYIHPHNAFLQVWFDLGFVGAMAAALALIGLYVSARRTVAANPALGAYLATGIAIAAVSHGFYQSWWLALVIIGFVYFHAFGRRPMQHRLLATSGA